MLISPSKCTHISIAFRNPKTFPIVKQTVAEVFTIELHQVFDVDRYTPNTLEVEVVTKSLVLNK